MSQWKKIMAAWVLILCFVISPYTVWATPQNPTTEEAAQIIKQMMDRIVEEYVGKEVDIKTLMDGALKGMFGTLDAYSEYYTPEEFQTFHESLSGEFVGVGIQVQSKNGLIEVIAPLPDSPAQRAGIQSGDLIVEVDGKSIKDMPLDVAISLIKGTVGTKVTVKILRGQESKIFTLTRAVIKNPQVIVKPIQEMLPEMGAASDLLYIQIIQFGEGVAEDLKKALEQAKKDQVKGIVFDVRYNPGGYLEEVIKICRMLVPEGPIVHTITKDGQKDTAYSYLSKAPFQMAVLVNEYSASASEIFAGAIQDAGVGVLVGQKTFGKGVVQEVNFLASGNAYKMTVQEYLTRNEKHIHEVGIVPDVVVDIPEGIEKIEKKLDKSSKGEEVLQLKKVLSFLGYDIGMMEDTYDEKTARAVYLFQKDQQLYAYGIADLTTQKKLNEVFLEQIQEKDLELQKAVDLLKAKK